MTGDDFAATLSRARIIPIVTMTDPDLALPVARALMEGGIGVVEITLRTDAGLDAIERLATSDIDVVVGVGSVLTGAAAGRAHAAGARFVVSPGFSADVNDACLKHGMPYLPGAVTATEVMACLDGGRRIIKFFPAEASGGLPVLKAILEPFAAAGLQAVPTGGIRLENLVQYLADSRVPAVGGSWLTPRDAVASGDWATLTRLASEAVVVAGAEHDA